MPPTEKRILASPLNRYAANAALSFCLIILFLREKIIHLKVKGALQARGFPFKMLISLVLGDSHENYDIPLLYERVVVYP